MKGSFSYPIPRKFSFQICFGIDYALCILPPTLCSRIIKKRTMVHQAFIHAQPAYSIAVHFSLFICQIFLNGSADGSVGVEMLPDRAGFVKRTSDLLCGPANGAVGCEKEKRKENS